MSIHSTTTGGLYLSPIQSIFSAVFGTVLALWCRSILPVSLGILLVSPVYGESDSSYLLSTGDVIKVLVYQEEDLSFEIKIDDTGTFSYPYLDVIRLKGRTPSDIEREITEGLRGRVLVEPNISVAIIEYRPFSIGGEVEEPGNYPYEPGLSVKKAINLAGGLTDWASRSKFRLERDSGESIESQNRDLDVGPGDTLTILPRRF